MKMNRNRSLLKTQNATFKEIYWHEMESDDANEKQAFINKKELFWHKEKETAILCLHENHTGNQNVRNMLRFLFFFCFLPLDATKYV